MRTIRTYDHRAAAVHGVTIKGVKVRDAEMVSGQE